MTPVTTCEPPHLFYSDQHRPGTPPCCPTMVGLCPGGLVCPPSGLCPGEGVPCTPGTRPIRPNVILMVSDDQGACHYGSAGECRSFATATPIPAPVTPNLDLLAGHGTVFPVAHNTAGWCLPSLASILTGRYQRSLGGTSRLTQDFPTLPQLLRTLGGPSAAPPDPYRSSVRTGGYCTLLAGKLLSGGPFSAGFDGRIRGSVRRLGRNDCVEGGPGEPPRCGSARREAYTPFVRDRMEGVFVFIDSLVYPEPDSDPPEFRLQPFFVWYAPRLPHQPLRSPQPVMDYLFGGLAQFPLGGLMNLGRWCTGGSCPPAVQALAEDNFGTGFGYYGNLWWVDDNIRELRRFLAALGTPHCINRRGRSRFDVTMPDDCPGTWASVSPDPAANTIIVYLSDNGWFLPNSKHSFSENGYRTRLIVFDPRALSEVPSWDPQEAVIPPPQESPALASATDVLPTVLGFALDTPGRQACPYGSDGRPCDGRDLRPHLATAPGGPEPPEMLRRSLCGHETLRPTAPSRFRYLLTRPGSVGRCAPVGGGACLVDGDCGSGQFCLGGYCTPAIAETPCSIDASCGPGGRCIANKCRVGMPCLSDDECVGLLGPGHTCVAKAERWCRNAPNVACATNDDCPACPSANGHPLPCGRLCEPRMLKLYLGGGGPSIELTDLFLDPDERGLHRNQPGSLTTFLSTSPAYAAARARMSCCLDAWWSPGPGAVTACGPGFSCPADLTCNE